MRVLSVLFLALIAWLPAGIQTIKLHGKVTDSDGVAIAGATITVKGATVATVTNDEGTFSIVVKEVPCVLLISSVGYVTQTYKVTSKNKAEPVLIKLKPLATDSVKEVVTTVGFSTDVAYDRVAEGSYVPSHDKAGTPSKKKVERAPGVTSGTSGGPRSGILTAGEVNDFKKWTLWSDYTSSDFKEMSDEWKLTMRNRYCVQVQNRDHQAVVGVPVQLINKDTRKVVWTGITDNTGKAELWSDLDKVDEQDRASYFIVCEKETLSYPITFENGINKITLNKTCSVSNDVDIAFVVDATGSMSDEIRYLQAELEDVIENVSKKHKDVRLRLGSVFYRDHGDAYLTRHIPLGKNLSSFTNFIKAQSAGGGGDFPEALDVALQVAIDSLQWNSSARTRIMFLVLDAPPHDRAKEDMKKLIVKAATKGIRVVPIACSGINKSTEYLLRCIALATNGSYVFLTDDSGVGNPHIKPTTDDFKVELLNALLQRLISEMVETVACNSKPLKEEPVVDTTQTIVQIKVFPNPTSGQVTLESSEPISEMYLTDFAGKVLQRIDLGKKKNRWTLNLNTYPSGAYLARYLQEGKGWGSAKIILFH